MTFFTGLVAQSLTCLAEDMCLTVDSGVASWILAWFHTFIEITDKIVSTATLLPSPNSRRVVVNYKRKYVHEVPVNYLVKLVHGKKCG